MLADCRHYYHVDLWDLPSHEAMDLIRRVHLYYRVSPQGEGKVFVHSAIEHWRERANERRSEQEPVASAADLGRFGISVRTV